MGAYLKANRASAPRNVETINVNANVNIKRNRWKVVKKIKTRKVREKVSFLDDWDSDNSNDDNSHSFFSKEEVVRMLLRKEP